MSENFTAESLEASVDSLIRNTFKDQSQAPKNRIAHDTTDEDGDMEKDLDDYEDEWPASKNRIVQDTTDDDGDMEKDEGRDKDIDEGQDKKIDEEMRSL